MSPVALMNARRGYAPVRSLIAAGDPDVRLVDGRWEMLFGAATTDWTVNLFRATLPSGAPITSEDWEIETDPADPGRALPLLDLPAPGSWDEWRHTPCHVVGVDPATGASVERVYYTGSRTRTDPDHHREMAVGVLERTATGWVPRPQPVLVGRSDRPDLLEPKVRYAEGRWRVWLQSTEAEPAPGEPPNCRIEYMESADGLTGWSEPTVLFAADEHRFDTVVTAVDGRYAAIVTAAPDLYDTGGFPEPGLWLHTADRPSGARADWSEPRRVLGGEALPEWCAAVYGPCAVAGVDATGAPVLHVFLTAAPRPDPDPFQLVIGRLDVPLAAAERGSSS